MILMMVVMVVVPPRSTCRMSVTFEVSKFNGMLKVDAPRNIPLEVAGREKRRKCEKRGREKRLGKPRRSHAITRCAHGRGAAEGPSAAYLPHVQHVRRVEVADLCVARAHVRPLVGAVRAVRVVRRVEAHHARHRARVPRGDVPVRHHRRGLVGAPQVQRRLELGQVRKRVIWYARNVVAVGSEAAHAKSGAARHKARVAWGGRECV